jgi:hypothetical protein
MRASCCGLLESFVDRAFGGATVVVVVVVVPVVVVPVVLPDVLVPDVVPPDVVVGADAVVVVGFPAPTPGFDVFAAALCVAPLFAPLFDPPDPPLVVSVGLPPLLVAAASAFGAPPLGAAPDLPCAATGATLTAAIAAAVAKSRNIFIYRVLPEGTGIQEECPAAGRHKARLLWGLGRLFRNATDAIGARSVQATSRFVSRALAERCAQFDKAYPVRQSVPRSSRT